AVWHPSSFYDDVVRFPLGYGKPRTFHPTPAPGVLLARAFPHLRGPIGAAAALAIVGLLVWLLSRRGPWSSSRVAAGAAAVLAVPRRQRSGRGGGVARPAPTAPPSAPGAGARRRRGDGSDVALGGGARPLGDGAGPLARDAGAGPGEGGRRRIRPPNGGRVRQRTARRAVRRGGRTSCPVDVAGSR